MKKYDRKNPFATLSATGINTPAMGIPYIDYVIKF